MAQVFYAQSGFDNGNTLYKQGNYQEAIDAYETIVYRSEKQSPELYFNIANCYYKLNKVAPTIYNYEKALLLNPAFEAAKNNLEIAKKLQIDDIKVIENRNIHKLQLKFKHKQHIHGHTNHEYTQRLSKHTNTQTPYHYS